MEQMVLCDVNKLLNQKGFGDTDLLPYIRIVLYRDIYLGVTCCLPFCIGLFCGVEIC